MPTLSEIEITSEEAKIKMEAIAKSFGTTQHALAHYNMHSIIGREVCARRARILRRRREDIRFMYFTSTGKARYSWVPKMPQITFIV